MALYGTPAYTPSVGGILPAALVGMGLVGGFLSLLVGLSWGSSLNHDWGWDEIHLISQQSCDHRYYHTLFEDEETEAQRDKQFAPSPSLL